MLEIAVVVAFLLALFSVAIVLPILLVVKAVRLLFGPAVNEVVSAVVKYGNITGETLTLPNERK